MEKLKEKDEHLGSVYFSYILERRIKIFVYVSSAHEREQWEGDQLTLLYGPLRILEKNDSKTNTILEILVHALF